MLTDGHSHYLTIARYQRPERGLGRSWRVDPAVAGDVFGTVILSKGREDRWSEVAARRFGGCVWRQEERSHACAAIIRLFRLPVTGQGSTPREIPAPRASHGTEDQKIISRDMIGLSFGLCKADLTILIPRRGRLHMYRRLSSQGPGAWEERRRVNDGPRPPRTFVSPVPDPKRAGIRAE